MTKLAAMAKYNKNLKKKKNLLRTKKADDLESWYASSGASTTKFAHMMTLG